VKCLEPLRRAANTKSSTQWAYSQCSRKAATPTSPSAETGRRLFEDPGRIASAIMKSILKLWKRADRTVPVERRTVSNPPNEAGSPCAAEANTKPVNFYCSAPVARSVSLVGDFNDWNSRAHPMHRRVDGWWFLQISVPHGHHRYRFLVDGKPVLDPRAMGVDRDESDEPVSMIAVS
jgi:hypothetical protein